MLADKELNKLRVWKAILLEIVKEFPGRTIENVIDNIDARIKIREEKQ